MARVSYSVELGDTICQRLADGESMRAICREAGMPDRASVKRWIAERPEFAAKCARAREEQAFADAERMQEILDSEPERIDGRIDPGWVQWAKTQISALQWFASKKAPKAFGDKLAIGGDTDGAPIRLLSVTERAHRLQAIVHAAAARIAPPAIEDDMKELGL